MTYFFIHTIKTSGTTFMEVIRKDAANNVGYFYPPKREMYDFEKRVKDAPFFNLEKNPDWQKFNFIGGHFTYGIHETLKATDYTYLGVIRNPVEHYVSMYKHFLRMPAEYRKVIMGGTTDSIETLLSLNYTHNMQTWFLSGLSMEEIRNDKEKAVEVVIKNADKYFAGVYPTERFDEGLFYFKHKIGLRPQCYKRKNVSKNSTGEQLTSELIQKIKAVNDADDKLFQYFSQKFDDELKNIQGIKREVAFFKLMNWLYQFRNKS